MGADGLIPTDFYSPNTTNAAMSWRPVVVAGALPPAVAERLQRAASWVEMPAVQEIPAPLRQHADLFLFQHKGVFVVAPNTPRSVVEVLLAQGAEVVVGRTLVNATTGSMGAYNVAVGVDVALCNPRWVDPVVREVLGAMPIVAVRQPLCRCGALVLSSRCILTSDGGIARMLRREGMEVRLVEAGKIVLTGYRSGCLGGCCCVASVGGRRVVLTTGRIDLLTGGSEALALLRREEVRVWALGGGWPVDVGSLFVVG